MNEIDLHFTKWVYCLGCNHRIIDQLIYDTNKLIPQIEDEKYREHLKEIVNKLEDVMRNMHP